VTLFRIFPSGPIDTFDPAEFKKCVQENLGTNAPIVNAAGERIGVLPTDVIQKYLVSNV
jgi:hypothetical protein